MSVRAGAVAWCIGAAWLQTRAQLPDATTWGSGALACCLIAVATAHRRRSREGWADAAVACIVVLAAFLAAVAWSAWRAELRLADHLAPDLENREVEAVGIVRGLPARVAGINGDGVRFEFEIEHAETPPNTVPSYVSLAWYPRTANGMTTDVPEVQPGERWRLVLKLKRPHGSYNPNGFDLEPWLLERGIRASGSVRGSARTAKLDVFVPSFDGAIDRMRASIARHVMNALPEHAYAGVMLALVVGDQRGIGADDWTMFNRTGVGHLLSISGLHITMFAALIAALAVRAWTFAVRRGFKPLMGVARMPFAAAFGFVAAAGYTVLSGFQVPAQRTLWMLGIVAFAWIARRAVRPSYLLALAAWIVIAIDPWAVSAPGFWLSFIAVACLLYAGIGLPPGSLLDAETRRAWWRAAVRSQLAIAVLLAPIGLLFFQQMSVVGPLANAIAIPAVSWLVTPLALFGGLVGWDWPLQLAHAVFAAVAVVLEWCAHLPGASLELPKPSIAAVVLAMLGGAWLLAPRGVPARIGALTLFVPLVWMPIEHAQAGGFRALFLDVGQGTAVLIETATHRLLYDTGPRWSDDADAGQRVVLPHLRAIGARRLDGLVVSHADADHSGGALSILDARDVDWLSTSMEPDSPIALAAHGRRRCEAGQAWTWDDVRFEVLHPNAAMYERANKTNAMSCVLRVSNAYGSLLLTADIEAAQERALLAGPEASLLKADVLAVPHHGSLTSSTSDFIRAVAPRIAVVQAGYLNRFGHPRADVLARYDGARIALSRTDRDGAVDVHVDEQGVRIERYREREARYWHGR